MPMISIASRPRTLLIQISATELEVTLLGPTGAIVGGLRIPRSAESDLPLDLQAMWPQLEPLGEFDRITASTGSGIGDAWDAAAVTRELESQSGRRVRMIAASELRWRQVIRGTGVELVLGLGAALESSLFFDGTMVPGLAIAAHRFRKGRSYGEYLAPKVLARKGTDEWNKRIGRAVTEVLAVWNPKTLYLAGPNAPHVTCELPEHVVVVRQPTSLDAALAVWTAPAADLLRSVL